MQRRSSLANRHYRNYFIASCFATMGIWMTRFLFAWLIWDATESFFWVGAASAAMLIPSLLVTPIFGVLADRINLKHGIVVLFFIQALAALLALVCFLIFGYSVWLILVLTFVFGLVAAAGSPLRLTLIPKLVTKAELPNAVGLGAMLFNSSRILAPALAAACLTVMSPFAVFSLCAAMYFIAAIVNLSLPTMPPSGHTNRASGWQEFVSGMQFSWAHPLIRLVFILTLVNSQVARSVMELLPAISGTVANGTPADLAMLTAFAGAGSIAGGWFVSRQHSDNKRIFNMLGIALLFTGIAMLPMLGQIPLVVLAVLIGVISLFMTILGTGSQILLQLNATDETRGRVMSLWLTIAITGPAFGAFLMGALAEWAGLKAMLAVMLVLSFLSAFDLWRQRHLVRPAHRLVEPEPSPSHNKATPT